MVRYMNLEEQVDRDFTHARRRAFLRRIKARLRKELACNRLLSFDEVKGSLGAFNKVGMFAEEISTNDKASRRPLSWSRRVLD